MRDVYQQQGSRLSLSIYFFSSSTGWETEREKGGLPPHPEMSGGDLVGRSAITGKATTPLSLRITTILIPFYAPFMLLST